jgi:TRAP-type C4-dicarboxylate transport system permease small subunit
MAVAGIAMVGLMLLASGNVILRMFGMPFAGTYELVGFLGALVIAFALGETQRRKDNVVVDIVSAGYRPVAARLTDAMQYLVTIAFFSIVAWRVFAYAGKVRETGELSETLKIIYHPVIYAVAFGFAMLALNLLVDLAAGLAAPKEER